MRKKVKQLGYCSYKGGFIYVLHHGMGKFEYFAVVAGEKQHILFYEKLRGN